MRLTDRQISNLVRRIIKEDEDLDIKGTVMKTAGFEEEDIPQECIGGNPNMSEIEMIQGCLGKITEKSTKLNDSIKALSDMLNKAKSTASNMGESRRFRRY
jgi:hypothetical protein